MPLTYSVKTPFSVLVRPIKPCVIINIIISIVMLFVISCIGLVVFMVSARIVVKTKQNKTFRGDSVIKFYDAIHLPTCIRYDYV